MINQKFFLKMPKNSLNSNFVSKHENIIRNFYSSRHLSIGNKINAVGWSSKKNQYLRFELLTSHIKKYEKVLDYGCGFCDMYFFFKKEKKIIKYYGYDLYDYKIKSKKIKIIKKVNKKFDHICCSGVFTYKTPYSERYIKCKIKDLFSKSQKSLSLNFLSNNSKIKLKKNIYFSLEKIIKLIKKISKSFIIYNNYKINEITVIILKK